MPRRSDYYRWGRIARPLPPPHDHGVAGATSFFQVFAVIPDSTDFVVPNDAPVGMELTIQELAVDLFTGNGNFSWEGILSAGRPSKATGTDSLYV